jgi:hypothetical protein
MASTLDVTTVATAATFEPDGDTAASDNAAIGYTSAEGLILTGQGSTNDVTIKNDADADVITIATGATNVDVVGDLTAGTLNADGDTAAGDNAAIGYTSAEGLILTGQGSTDDVTIKNDADATVLQVATGGVDVEITAGNLIMGTSGKGIDFGATGGPTAGSGTSELLDDYEEGTWTAQWSDGSNNATMGTEAVIYTKIGRMVFISGYVVCTSTDSMSGDIQLNTLPFTSASGNSYYSAGSVGEATSLAITAGHGVHLTIYQNTSYLVLFVSDSTAGNTQMQDSELSDGGTILFSAMYVAA